MPERLRRTDLAAGLTAAGFADVVVVERPAWDAVELALWTEAAVLDPAGDPALESVHDEAVRSLATHDLRRRVMATATAQPAR